MQIQVYLALHFPFLANSALCQTEHFPSISLSLLIHFLAKWRDPAPYEEHLSHPLKDGTETIPEKRIGTRRRKHRGRLWTRAGWGMGWAWGGNAGHPLPSRLRQGLGKRHDLPHRGTAELRRLRQYLIYSYKIIFGLIDIDCSRFFTVTPNETTRGHA